MTQLLPGTAFGVSVLTALFSGLIACLVIHHKPREAVKDCFAFVFDLFCGSVIGDTILTAFGARLPSWPAGGGR